MARSCDGCCPGVPLLVGYRVMPGQPSCCSVGTHPSPPRHRPTLQIDYWKEQAGLPPHKRDYVDLEEIVDSKQNGAGDGAPPLRWRQQGMDTGWGTVDCLGCMPLSATLMQLPR